MDPQKITFQSNSDCWWNCCHCFLQNRMQHSGAGGKMLIYTWACLFLLMHSRFFLRHREHHIFFNLILMVQKRTTRGFQERIPNRSKNYISTLKFIFFFFSFFYSHLILLCIIILRQFWHMYPFNVSFGIIFSHSNNLANLYMLIDY